MKFDKKNIAHWVVLFCFSLFSLIALPLRLVNRQASNKIRPIIFYGHKLNGNLLPLYQYLKQREVELALNPVYLTMDRTYQRELQSNGVNAIWAASPKCIVVLSQGKAIISSHGLHALQPLVKPYRKTNMLFFDVWHGIPFKGFDADDFKLQHLYDETWVASELCRQLYIERFGFNVNRVKATGYARTDCLVQSGNSIKSLRSSLGLPKQGKLILFAPTWVQDSKGRSIYPFEHDEEGFLRVLSSVAKQHDATILLRTHLNSENTGHDDSLPQGIISLPGSRYPDTEAILLVSDILICDWSSIAFDYLLLKRPTIFLDVPPPFRKGLSLGVEYRFGAVVESLSSLLVQLDICLSRVEEYWSRHGAQHKYIESQVYGDRADGKASERCIKRLLEQISSKH